MPTKLMYNVIIIIIASYTYTILYTTWYTPRLVYHVGKLVCSRDNLVYNVVNHSPW